MRTKTAARCASRSLRAHRLQALARLALVLLGALLASCIGPGLEPPDGERGANNPNVTPPTLPTVDASTGPGFGNTGSGTDDGETMSPDPTEPPGTDEPAPQAPSDPSNEADEDAGIDTGDESP